MRYGLAIAAALVSLVTGATIATAAWQKSGTGPASGMIGEWAVAAGSDVSYITFYWPGSTAAMQVAADDTSGVSNPDIIAVTTATGTTSTPFTLTIGGVANPPDSEGGLTRLGHCVATYRPAFGGSTTGLTGTVSLYQSASQTVVKILAFPTTAGGTAWSGATATVNPTASTRAQVMLMCAKS